MSSLGETIRARLRAGHLPYRRPQHTYAGHGSGASCSGCTVPILAAQVEYKFEMASGEQFRLHIGCHGLWEAECIRQGWRRTQAI